jgi:hypothetical protein
MRTAGFLVAGVMWLALASAWSDVPKTISYQGILKKADGTAMVPDGGYNIVFSIYNLASGGTLKYRETQAVQVKNGFYAVVIGTGTPRPESPVASLSLLSFNDEYWLGITVGADPTLANTELTPRVRLTASPYALNADTVDSVHAADLLDKATYDINKDGTVDVAAVAKGVQFTGDVNLQLSGGYIAVGSRSASSPGFTFTGDLDTGIYEPAANALGFSTGGTNRLTLSATGVDAGSGAITTTGTLSTGAATVTSLNAGSGAVTTTGTLTAGTSTLGATTVSGTNDLTVGGEIVGAVGAVGTPSLTFSGDTDTGIYHPAANSLALVTAGIDRLMINSSGTVTAAGTLAAANITTTGTITGLGMVPIGSIIAWHNTMVSGLVGVSDVLAAGFALCNGQTPLQQGISGAVITAATPNLNGDGRFLRGGSNSGTMQDDAFQNHLHGITDPTHSHPLKSSHGTDTGSQDFQTEVVDSSSLSGLRNKPASTGITATNASTDGGTETRPTNMSVLWIMRVK